MTEIRLKNLKYVQGFMGGTVSRPPEGLRLKQVARQLEKRLLRQSIICDVEVLE